MFLTMFEKIQNIMLTMHISDVFQTINKIPESFTNISNVKYWIEGTFYWPKNSKKGTEYVPRNTSRR